MDYYLVYGLRDMWVCEDKGAGEGFTKPVLFARHPTGDFFVQRSLNRKRLSPQNIASDISIIASDKKIPQLHIKIVAKEKRRVVSKTFCADGKRQMTIEFEGF